MSGDGVGRFELERRRTPRVQSQGTVEVDLDAAIPVQVLDISLSGVLLASKAELIVGDRAVFRATVGSRSLQVAVEIRRVSIDPVSRGGMRYRAGAVFTGMHAEQRVALEQLLGGERS
jgi:hypothetical protein